MKKMTQFRFYGNGSGKNSPLNLTTTKLNNDNIFAECGSISQLGIQAPPGTIFTLNESSAPIMVGKTGIYELDLEAIGRIHSIRFIEEDLEEYFADKELHNRLLIDIVYDGGTSV